MLGGINIGYIIMKIIRVLWGNNVTHEIPKQPLFPNIEEIVYVYGIENFWLLKERGYNIRLVKEDLFNGELNWFGKKLQVLDLALQEFGEVLLLDWDCYLARPLDDNFFKSLKEKPIQIPLYIQHKDTKNAILEILSQQHSKLLNELTELEKGFKKYGWEWEEGIVAPNFGFVYCRDKTFGKKLVDIAKKHNLNSVVDEFATLIYANCTLDEYIDKYTPEVLFGRSNNILIYDCRLHEIGRKFNQFLNKKLKINPYFEHV